MSYIYLITNIKNGKGYVGKTQSSIKERFRQHIRDSKKERTEKRPLYFAMRKYGHEFFRVEMLEECSDDILIEKEIEWISKLGTFKNGYNATVGGDGKPFVDYELIERVYAETENQRETSRLTGFSVDTIRDFLRKKEIGTSLKPAYYVNSPKMVKMMDETKTILRIFSSAREAGKYLKNSNAGTHISDVCNGKRKTAYGYFWEYL